MFCRLTTSTAALIALSAPAFADVTPAEVWQSWLDYYKAAGYTVTEGSRDETNGTLTIHDLSVAMARDLAPNEGHVNLQVQVPQVTLAPTGDGAVRSTLPESLTVNYQGTDAAGEDVAMVISASLPGNEMVSTGTPGDMTHRATNPQATVTVESIHGKDFDLVKPVTVTATNVTAEDHRTKAGGMHSVSTAAAEKVEVKVAVDKPQEDKPVSLNGTFTANGLKVATDMNLTEGADLGADVNAALKAGSALKANVAFDSMTGRFDAKGSEEGKDVSASGTVDAKGTNATLAISRDGIAYQVDGDGMNITVNSNQAPVPITYGFQSSSFGMQLPVMKSDTPAPFKFAYSLGGVTMGDAIWDLFDKGRKLPRDPANIDVDVTGQMRVNADLLDPAAMKAMAEKDQTTEPAAGQTAAPAQPFTPTEVAINKIALNAVGAKVDASGQMTFPDGATDPVGRVNARMEGVNGLIDTLVAMGFVKQDEVAGYRMMLAMIAKPAPEGGDALVSEIEMREGGQIFANGQQVK